MRRKIDSSRRCLKATSLFALAAFLWALPIASRAVMLGLSTEDLVKEADLVVLGDVESAGAKWSEDGKAIFTTAIVVVLEAIKGQPVGQRIEVEYPGGEVGGIGMRVSDAPGMKKGEKVLLFLKHVRRADESDKYLLVGKGQGKYSIGPDGVARKKGFSLAGGTKPIDAEVPLDTLIETIKRVK